MRNKFDEQLRQLNEELLQMGAMVEDAIQRSTQALFVQDQDMARIIMDGDVKVDQKQKDIEQICFHLLVQQQPVARDLRIITTAMHMVRDMERIGDQAADISELTIMMAGRPYMLKQDNIRKMAGETVLMVIHAIEAYIEKNMAKAEEVIAHDDIVDALFLEVKSELIEIMKTQPEYEDQAADLLMVNKYLERIGDHATNIAEAVCACLDDHR